MHIILQINYHYFVKERFIALGYQNNEIYNGVKLYKNRKYWNKPLSTVGSQHVLLGKVSQASVIVKLNACLKIVRMWPVLLEKQLNKQKLNSRNCTKLWNITGKKHDLQKGKKVLPNEW